MNVILEFCESFTEFGIEEGDPRLDSMLLIVTSLWSDDVQVITTVTTVAEKKTSPPGSIFTLATPFQHANAEPRAPATATPSAPQTEWRRLVMFCFADHRIPQKSGAYLFQGALTTINRASRILVRSVAASNATKYSNYRYLSSGRNPVFATLFLPLPAGHDPSGTTTDV